jgi:hypothetical protein
VSSATLKEIAFEGYNPKQGYFAVKDKKKYFIDKSILKELPIRVRDTEEMLYKEDVVFIPTNPVRFRIVPELKMDMRQMIDYFCPFTHTQEQQWLLMKIIAIASMIGKTFVCVATEPAFGKSSIFNVVHSLTDKVPVFKPRSIPGVLSKITGDGNMVFDEIQECKKDVKDIIEDVALQVAGNQPEYINGALKSKNTKSRYDCSLQSITFLYNDVSCYKNPQKSYFEYIFTNNKAMDDRFLKLRMNGILTEKFDRRFNVVKTAEDCRVKYIDFVKSLEYYKDIKLRNDYTVKFRPTTYLLDLKGRKRTIFNEIVWVIDQYCTSQEEFDSLYKALEFTVIRYKEMVNEIENEGQSVLVTEEKI